MFQGYSIFLKGIFMSPIKAFVVSASVFASVLAFGSVSAANRMLTVVNKSTTAMVAFYASNVGTNDWEEDILGQDVLLAGQSVRINMDDGTGYCRFDLKAEFDDGSEAIEENVNVCEVGTFTFTD